MSERPPARGVVGVGVDLVDVGRFARSLDRTPTLARRLFVPGEVAYAERSGAAGRAQRLAARFAAKEATMKALGVGLGAFRFVDVAVDRGPSGEPSLRVTGAAASLAASRGVGGWMVSLSHTATMAHATVLALSGFEPDH